MALTLPVGSLLFIDTGTDATTPTWTKLSEHNRQPVSLDTKRIERAERMANGTMRKIFIADKAALEFIGFFNNDGVVFVYIIRSKSI